jgi:chaperonin GroES
MIPLGKNVILKPIIKEDKTESGIILSTKQVEKTNEAEVIAVSEESEKYISVGDTVIYCKYSGTMVDDLLIVDIDDILAIRDKGV